MQITEAEWKKYKDALSAIDKQAVRELSEWLNSRGGYLMVDREELINYAYALATQYGEASGALSALFYDEIADMSGVIVAPAEVAETASISKVASTINGIVKKLTTDDAISQAIGRLVKEVGAETTLQNAKRDGAQFAWIPSGDTCPFCITLASRGWQYTTKKTHAYHIHSNCDCTYAIRFSEKDNVAGYNPDKYYEQYKSAEGSGQEKINYMRRMQYKENKDKINAQKRANYAERKENEKIIKGEE